MKRIWKCQKTFSMAVAGAPLQIRDIRLLTLAAGQHGGGRLFDVILRPGQVSGECRAKVQTKIAFCLSSPTWRERVFRGDGHGHLQAASEPCRPARLAAEMCRRESLFVLNSQVAFASPPLSSPNSPDKRRHCLYYAGHNVPCCAESLAQWSDWKRGAFRSAFLQNRLPVGTTRWKTQLAGDLH